MRTRKLWRPTGQVRSDARADTDAPDLMLDENYTLTQTTGYRQRPRGMVDADQAR